MELLIHHLRHDIVLQCRTRDETCPQPYFVKSVCALIDRSFSTVSFVTVELQTKTVFTYLLDVIVRQC